MSHERGALFDVGYCLMDETPRLEAYCRWLEGFAADLGRPITAARLLEAYRGVCARPASGHPSLIVQTLLALGFRRDDVLDLRSRVPWDAVPLVPYRGAQCALERLRAAGLRVGVLANQPASASEDLRRTGLAALCDGVWLSEAVGLSKPDPAFFQLAASAWNLEPAAIAYVGDRPDNDVAPARRAGMHAVRVRTGPHAAQEPAAEIEIAHFDAPSLEAAADYLLGWASGR